MVATGGVADPEVEAFLAVNPVDQGTAFRFRALPLSLQRLVMMRGSLVGTRDPSAVLMSRVRDAIQSGGSNSSAGAQPLPPPTASSNPEVEAFLAANPVDFQAASRLRALPQHLQRLVLIRGSLSGVRDASSVLMSRVRDALSGGLGTANAAPSPASLPASQQPPNFRTGDWMCPKCNFHNYSSKIACTQCGTIMPNAGSIMGMSGSMMPGMIIG
uniref:RanBP2-type domain-containing protein n=1 Tax=Alexandrium catenella TaxID=2925 RepID=A0A7S1R5Y1_ALECA